MFLNNPANQIPVLATPVITDVYPTNGNAYLTIPSITINSYYPVSLVIKVNGSVYSTTVLTTGTAGATQAIAVGNPLAGTYSQGMQVQVLLECLDQSSESNTFTSVYTAFVYPVLAPSEVDVNASQVGSAITANGSWTSPYDDRTYYQTVYQAEIVYYQFSDPGTTQTISLGTFPIPAIPGTVSFSDTVFTNFWGSTGNYEMYLRVRLIAENQAQGWVTSGLYVFGP